MSQKTGISIFLAAAILAAAVLFYAVFTDNDNSVNDIYASLLEQEGLEIQEDTNGISDSLEEGLEDREYSLEPSKTIAEERTICAFVCGKVRNAGIYELLEGARLSDFISAAGGFSKQAAKEYLNLAEKAEDGQRIYVPSKKEVKKQKQKAENKKEGSLNDFDGQDSTKEKTDNRVNINTAGKEELMTLTGIGEAKADAIIHYREKEGAFHTTEELMQIPGIKEGVYNKICDNITV